MGDMVTSILYLSHPQSESELAGKEVLEELSPGEHSWPGSYCDGESHHLCLEVTHRHAAEVDTTSFCQVSEYKCNEILGTFITFVYYICSLKGLLHRYHDAKECIVVLKLMGLCYVVCNE